MFSDTVKNNITLEQGAAISEEGRQALYHSTTVDTFLGLLPNGEETQIGEGGMDLSKGQQQRVAIARGLAKDAPLLLLDEATSALDAQSDKQVTRAVLDAKNVAVLAVTHRLTYLKDFDTIYVMEDGRIVEYGTPNDLLAAGGVYARLLKTQKEAAR